MMSTCNILPQQYPQVLDPSQFNKDETIRVYLRKPSELTFPSHVTPGVQAGTADCFSDCTDSNLVSKDRYGNPITHKNGHELSLI